MALQSLARPIYWPNIAAFGTGSRLFSNTSAIDAAGEYQGFVFRATEAMTISHVMFRTGTVSTGSPTLDVRIETVDATTGLPTGTLWATNTNVVTSALAAATMYTVALTASASIAAGDIVCVKFLYNSGTAAYLVNVLSGAPHSSSSLPYIVSNGAVSTFTAARLMALGSSSTAFYNVTGLLPLSAAAVQLFSTDEGDAYGNRFQVPFKCRCIGLMFPTNGAAGEYSFGLYSDAGSELSSSSTGPYDVDLDASSAGATMHLIFDNPVTLSPATWYRAALWPTNTADAGIYKWTTATDASEAMPYTNFHYTTKATGGAWTDTATTEALVMDLIIDQLDDGVSTGGGIKLAGRGGLAG